jgi:DNA invertase Pin-like site-specific DNA recombinase
MMTMAKIGYARVSTKGQNDDSQVDELNAYGCDKVFTDHGVSGKHASRPQLDAALEYMRPGDTFVITRLSRAMRSLHQLLDVVNGTRASDYQDGLKARGIGLVVLKQGIDTTTPQGRLVFHIFGAIDEFQRELIVEGTREGLEAARRKGHVGGRKAKLNAKQLAEVRKLFAEDRPPREICELFGISRATLYRIVGTEAERAAAAAT